MTNTVSEQAIPARAQGDPRRRAREVAVQLLYQAELGGPSLEGVADHFWPLAEEDEVHLDEAGRGSAMAMAAGVREAVARIDPLIAEAATHWRIERMTVVDRLILRLAVYELLETPDTPAKVVINEALELARTFSSDDAVRFVNGIVDAVRRKLERV